MIDLMSATQEGVYGPLKAAVSLAAVHDHVKQGTQPPFVQLGSIDSSNEGTKHEQRELISFEVHTIYRGADRRELLAIMHEVRQLDGVVPEVDGVSYSAIEFVNQVASNAGSDGVTYAGISTFEIYAEPA